MLQNIFAQTFDNIRFTESKHEILKIYETKKKKQNGRQNERTQLLEISPKGD